MATTLSPSEFEFFVGYFVKNICIKFCNYRFLFYRHDCSYAQWFSFCFFIIYLPHFYPCSHLIFICTNCIMHLYECDLRSLLFLFLRMFYEFVFLVLWCSFLLLRLVMGFFSKLEQFRKYFVKAQIEINSLVGRQFVGLVSIVWHGRIIKL